MYTAIVLTEEYQEKLQSILGHPYNDPDTGWQMICHHVTICMGRMKGKYTFELGEEVEIQISGAGKAHGFTIPIDKRKGIPLDAEVAFAATVRLPEGKSVKNDVPHITLAVNRGIGGKPFHSNFSTWAEFPEGPTEEWMSSVKGVVQECS